MPPARTRPTDPDSKASASSHPYASHKRKTGDKANAKNADSAGNSGSGNLHGSSSGSGSLLNWHAAHPERTTPTHATSTHLPLQNNTSESTTSFLRNYTYAHRLPLSCFSNPLNAAILSGGGIASHSPTMAKKAQSTSTSASTTNSISNSQSNNGSKGVQWNGTAHTTSSESESDRGTERPGKVTPTQLIQGVRKHFNDVAVSESDVITEFVYVVKEGARREFRLRFAPGVGGKSR